MLTRCPRCGTNFRVTPQQLKARQGRVRCGSCQAVFNALETLVEEAAIAEPAAGLAESRTAPESPELPDARPGAPGLPTAEVALPLADAMTEPIAADAEAAAAEAAPEPVVESAPDSPAKGEPELLLAAADAAPDEAPPAAAALPAPEPEPEREPEPEAADAPWPGPEPLLHEDDSARRRWPWVVGGLLAFAALAVQVMLHYRVELAVAAPETRPALLAACELFGCELSLPRKIEMIGIETSDLHPDATAGQKFGLTATLRNRAPFAQVWPALELTLTDTNDRALVRRVLQPAEYLPEKVSAAAGFPAGSDQAISLAIEATEVPAVGYRLYVFYP